jgi:hypothetical protein
MLHVAGKTQGQHLWLMFFEDFLSNCNSGLYLEAFNGSNSLEKHGKEFLLPSILLP